MKLLPRCFILGTLLLAPALFATDSFEGKVSLLITTAKSKPQTLNYALKGQALRIDIDTGKDGTFGTIMDLGRHEMLIIMNAQQMYMTMPMKGLEAKASAAAGAAGSTSQLEKTGKTEIILGYKCEQLLMHDKGHNTEAWVAEGLGNFMGLGGGGPMGGGRKPSAWESTLKGQGGFPLRVIDRDTGGKEVFRMEATKIEPGSLPDSLFGPPDGFQKFSMPDLGGLFKQG